jgi:hypothetical protein
LTDALTNTWAKNQGYKLGMEQYGASFDPPILVKNDMMTVPNGRKHPFGVALRIGLAVFRTLEGGGSAVRHGHGGYCSARYGFGNQDQWSSI